MDRNDKSNEALAIYERIHDYSIKYEESLFRKDYIMSYLRILIVMNNYNNATRVLKREIEFLKTCDKCQYRGIETYILDLMIIYMITNNRKEI